MLVNDSYIYDIANDKEYPLQTSMEDWRYYQHDMHYLGDWNEEPVFSICFTGDTYFGREIVFFMDHTLIPLCEEARASHIEQEGMIEIERQGLSITIGLDELHNYVPGNQMRQEVIGDDMEIIIEKYEEKSIPEDVGFRVDIEVPRGNTKADRTIKRYIFQAICDDIFYLLDYDSKSLWLSKSG